MDYEKKYKEALSKAKELSDSNPSDEGVQKWIQDTFPELRESEDERIRKALMQNLKERFGRKGNMGEDLDMPDVLAWLEKQKEVYDNGFHDGYQFGIHEEKPFKWTKHDEAVRKEAISCLKYWKNIIPNESAEDYKNILYWLENELSIHTEKQGEKKPADYENPNIQQNDFAPKSAMEAIKEEKVDNANKVEQKFKEGDWVVYQNQTFQVTKNSGNNLILQGRRYQTYFIEELCKPWTIDDAKDGDVLSFNDGHGNDSIELIKSITDKKIEFWFCLTNSNRYEVFDGITPYTNIVSRKDATPATKEQRDILFKAMKEAGYEWDAEKKELKKIEHNPAEWSEMDEEYLNNAIYACLNQYGNISVTAIWLKSLKGRVLPQPKWSEEEKKRIDRIIDVLDWAEDKGRISYSDWEDYVTYVRCLRPQPIAKERLENINQKIEEI